MNCCELCCSDSPAGDRVSFEEFVACTFQVARNLWRTWWNSRGPDWWCDCERPSVVSLTDYSSKCDG